MAKVDINTKMITLLGDPLKQSFAAQMQNCGYEAAGLNMIYFYTEVNNEHLADVVNGIRYMNFAGFAVTKPKFLSTLMSWTHYARRWEQVTQLLKLRKVN